jgi:glucosamine--fructose-6-phosphate aminotransferase (isomerizing)
MCGILGYIGERPAVDILIRGLRRLEYRGYDSAGIAFWHDGHIEIKKAEGKLQNVEKTLDTSSVAVSTSKCGIGHTRWATHGKPTTQNAHPHRTGHVVLVHNGIIENYQEIKRELMSRGHLPKSETDSELFGFLVLEEMDRGSDLLEGVRKSFARLHGQCSVVVMSEKEPGVIVGVRNGSPLVAALDPKGGCILASDAQPLLEFTKDVYFLEHGDVVIGTRDGLKFVDLETGKSLQRESHRLDWSVDQLDKQGYEHFMLKEIFEQPTALLDTLNGLIDRAQVDLLRLADHPGKSLLENASEISVVACGTSWHAALLGKYWLERWAKIPVNVELASEFRYRDHVLRPGAVVIGITQSGETADTLAVIRDMKKKSVPTLAVTNVRGSTVSREADATFYTSAGPEIGVAATKTFIAQMLTMLVFAGCLNRGSETPLDDIIRLPHLVSGLLQSSSPTIRAIEAAAQSLVSSKGFFFIGRGYSFPIALEGALKLKEIAYVHAEGYAAGELKHGPIAMIDEQMTVVVLAPRDAWRDKTVSNLEEVKARGAKILGVGDPEDKELESLCDHWVPLSSVPSDAALLPFVLTPVVQLLSYRIAVLKNTDVDKPRNLAKSVTVE